MSFTDMDKMYNMHNTEHILREFGEHKIPVHL